MFGTGKLAVIQQKVGPVHHFTFSIYLILVQCCRFLRWLCLLSLAASMSMLRMWAATGVRPATVPRSSLKLVLLLMGSLYVWLRTIQSRPDHFLYCCHYRSQSAITSTFALTLVAARVPDVSVTTYPSIFIFILLRHNSFIALTWNLVLILAGDLTIFNSNSSTEKISTQACNAAFNSIKIDCGSSIVS